MLPISRPIIGFSLFLFALSCGNKDESADDRLIFRYNQSTGISSLDPAFARVQGNIWACRQLFNTLVDLDDALLPVPSLARTWEILDSGKTYRFTLRKGVRFHTFTCGDSTIAGLPLKASDVKYSLERLTEPTLASPGGWVMRAVDSIEVISDSVLEIHLHRSFPPFLSMLSMAYCSVVPEQAFRCEDRNFGQHPVGTGAFHFQRWLWNEKLVLRKNTTYFETDSLGYALPYLDAISIRFLPDKQAEYLELLRGRIDMVSGLDPSYVDDALMADGMLNPRHAERIRMLKGPYLNTEYLGIFLEDLPDGKHALQDIRLRNAAHAAIDRALMLKYLRKGVGEAAGASIVPSSLPGSYSVDADTSYQLEKARALVDAWKEENNGAPPKVKLHTSAAYLDLIEFVQAAWQSVGFEAEVELMPAAALREGMANGKLQVFRASWIADYPDAQNYLSLFYSMNHAPNGPNYTHFTNTTFDSIYVCALQETDHGKRSTQYRQLDSIAAAQFAVIPLYYDQAIRFVGEDWEGLEPNALNLLDLRRAYKRPTSATMGK